MQRDILITFGGIAATGAFVFGCGLFVAGSVIGSGAKTPTHQPTEAHESKTEHASSGASKQETPKQEAPSHGEKKKKGPDDSGEKQRSVDKHDSKRAAPILEDDSEELGQFILRYNDLLVRGMSDDARVIALKAYALSGQKDAVWLRRLADATYLSDALPAQQRFAKAYENYCALLVGVENSEAQNGDREWAQYRACVCLRQMGRWDEALEASKNYLKQFSMTPRQPEVRLMHAQGLFVNGQLSDAREEIEQILTGTPNADVRARALLELAKIDAERVRVEPVDAPVQGLARAEVIPLNESPSSAAAEEIAGLPSARWQAIVKAAKSGELEEAQNLLEPIVRSGGLLNAEQRARVILNFAKLLRELPIPGSSH